ncbi:hypothetical protein [Streptomyces sp. NPDC006285]|uniref:hypothetical protein n=1 Tax=Streptomyces sp. NPDC006285 TaxID=3364742 RepID=UPI003673ECDB
MSEQKIGQLLDSLGVEADIEEGDLVAAAFVILKVIKTDGTVSLANARSEGLDWITRLGMVTATAAIENTGFIDTPSTDDT